MKIDSPSVSTASEWHRPFKDGLSYIANNLDSNKINIKTFKSLMIEDSRITAE